MIICSCLATSEDTYINWVLNDKPVLDSEGNVITTFLCGKVCGACKYDLDKIQEGMED
jgi:hypothetical protein